MKNAAAFPSDSFSNAGMTLRDYFAAKAIGLFGIEEKQLADLIQGDTPNHEVVARFCYGLADAMMAEREKETK